MAIPLKLGYTATHPVPPILMTADDNSSAPAPQKITVGLVVGWFFGLAFGLVALGFLMQREFLSGVIVAALAGLCLPPVDRLMRKRWNVHLSGGLKVLAVLAGLFLLGYVGEATPSGGSGTTVDSRQRTETPVSVTARELFQAYESNAIAADDRYKGKLLRVTGTIDDIDKDIVDSPYITLGTDSMVFSVQCMLTGDSARQAARLNRDARVTVVGRNSGKLGNIILEECSLQ